MEYQKIKPWIICFAASLLFFYEFIQGNMFASIADDIMRDFHIQAHQMVYLSSIYYVANVLFLFVAGMILDRCSVKKLLVWSMFFCVLSTWILSKTDSFNIAFMCRFVIGIGSAFCFLGPIRIATRWFSEKQMAFVTGAIVTMAMSGGLLAQYPLMSLVHIVGWRSALMVVSIMGLLMWIVMIRLIEDAPLGVEVHPHTVKTNIWSLTKQAYLNGQTLIAGSYASLMNMGVAVFGAVMGQLYLIQRLTIDQQQASCINGMLFFGAMLGGPLIGLWSDKMGSRLVPMRIGAMISLGIALAILYAPINGVMMGFLFFLLGFMTSAQVISYPLVAERAHPTLIALSISLVSILLQGGYVVYQNMYSFILTSFGPAHVLNGAPVYGVSAYQGATFILPCGFFLALLLTFFLKEKE